MNGASIPVPSGPPAGRPPTALPDGSPDELAAALPPGNVVVLGGPGSGKTALLEAAMHRLLARPGGTARLLTSSRQAALASTERLLAALTTAAGGALGCVTWYAFARGLVTSHADLLHYRGEPRPLSGPEQWALVRSLLQLDPPEVDWGELAPLVDTRAFTDELAELVLACERRVIDPDELLARARAEDRPSWAHAAAFLTVYHDHLALQDAVDQAGLVVQAGDLLEDRPDVLAATDAFRGASPGALPAFAERLGASVVLLERSRRLGGPGLDAVRRLQAAGTGPAVALAGGGTTTEEAEAVARLLRVAHERDGVPYGRMAVLLPSTRRLGGPVRRALERFGVPYRLGAGERQLVAEPVVGHVLDLFRLALDPTRADELLPPLLTSPLGGLDPGELRALRRAAVLADRSLAEHVRDPDGAAADPDGAAADPDDGEGADTPPGEPEGGPRPAAPVTLDPTLRRRVAALCELLGRAEGWVAELDADACFWEVWRHAPAFAELVTRAEADPSDADVQRQLDALTAFSRALGLFVDGRPGASMRTYLDVVERADFTGDPWLPPAVAGSDAVALLSINAAKGHEFDLVVVAGCLEGALPGAASPHGLFEAWRLDGDPGPVARARAALEAERRQFVLAASRARDRVVFTASRVDGRGEPSRFLLDLGLELPADPAPPEQTPLGPLEAAGALRRVMADRDRPAAERLAAGTTLAAMPGIDPGTWWWRRDWTADPEPIAAEGRLRTSYSRIGTYEDCHLKYFFGSVAGLDDRSSYQMAFGRLMHTIFELAAKGEVAGDPG